ncbi:MAG TPA: glycosyltransferase family 2 protein [Candidatus Saccharimonadales bacterium]|jgi:GT2 family glycosyltransferase|nr:glycosyltransferase family 2 protein [Candidatus Saccharimonadales bacterium]
MRNTVYVIIPNWNGGQRLGVCIESVLAQSYKNLIVVIVDNGSHDNSRAIIEKYAKQDSRVRSVYRDKNYGYTGGVNPGFELAVNEGAEYAAPFNNDAIADKDWLKHLVGYLDAHKRYGIAACTILHADGKTIDSTADQYTTWGIPFPRGRDEPSSARYDQDTDIFGASGGASMYRVSMLKKIGLLDQDFFAYYEDIDLSFRAQLAGWKVAFVPKSVVFHEQGKTSAQLAKRKTDGRVATTFTTKQYMKNLPFILVKDMPLPLLLHVLPRFCLAYSLFFLKSFTEGRGGGALKGLGLFWANFPKKLVQRRRIQKSRTVTNAYLWSLFVHDLPPNAYKLKRLRALWRRLTAPV